MNFSPSSFKISICHDININYPSNELNIQYSNKKFYKTLLVLIITHLRKMVNFGCLIAAYLLRVVPTCAYAIFINIPSGKMETVSIAQLCGVAACEIFSH